MLKDLIRSRKDQIIRKWTDLVHGTYPFNTVGFLRTRSDRFINPVGQRTDRAAQAFVESLCADTPDEKDLREATMDFIRVRAVQDFSAEETVSVLFNLKPIIRETLGEDLAKFIKEHGPQEMWELEANIDALALLAFAAYAACRDKVAELRIDELKRRQSQVLRQAERVLNEDFADLYTGARNRKKKNGE